MDANKLVVLVEVGYHVKRTCASCVHSVFPSPNSDWGTCEKYQYQHEKHKGPPRQLSINKAGRCRDGYEADPVAMTLLGAFGALAEGI